MFRKGLYFDAPNDGKGGSPADPPTTATSPASADDPQKAGADPQKAGADKKFTQADVDRFIAERLQRDRQAQKEKEEEIKRQAEIEAAKKQGEWQKVAEQREAELRRLTAEAKDKDIKLAAVRLGIKDPDYAVYLVNKAGENANVEQVLGDYVKANPAVVTTSENNQSNSDTQSSKNPTNPAVNNQVFTRVQLRDPTFYAANKEAILQAAREGRIKEE